MVERRSPKPHVGGSSPSWPVGSLSWFSKEVPMKKIIRYFKECVAEMKKVSWPTRTVVLQSTAVVIVSTIIFAIVLGLVDVLLGLGLDLLF